MILLKYTGIGISNLLKYYKFKNTDDGFITAEIDSNENKSGPYL